MGRGQGLGAPGEARWWKEQEGKEGTGGALMVSELLGVSSWGTPGAGARHQGRDGYGNSRKLGAGGLGRGKGELAGELSRGKKWG